jgi:LuxR family transcriptional regulator, regulator of acetate metabolism
LPLPPRRAVRPSASSGRPAPLAGVSQALRGLRPAASLPALFNRATHEICESMGFERAVVFGLRGQTLVAECAHVRGTAGAGERVLADLRLTPLQLGPRLHESEVLRRRRSLLVTDAARDPRALARLPGARSYVEAPIICREKALGLVQADRGVTGQAVTELDRDTLWAFVEGFGYAVERELLAERLRVESERILALVRSAEASVTELGRPEIALSSPQAGSSSSGLPWELPSRGSPRVPDPDLDDLLTRREREVLDMLAEGATNVGIAQQLVVSEGTVKTHVKHILRKLGVQNRSQAVSRYYRMRAA